MKFKTMTALAVASAFSGPLSGSADTTIFRAGPQAFVPPSVTNPQSWNYSDLRAVTSSPMSAEDSRTWHGSANAADRNAGMIAGTLPAPIGAMSAEDERTWKFGPRASVDRQDDMVGYGLRPSEDYLVILPEPASAGFDRTSDYMFLVPQQDASSVAARSDSPTEAENPVMADYLIIVPSEISG